MSSAEVAPLPEAFSGTHRIDMRPGLPALSPMQVALEAALAGPRLAVLVGRLLADRRVPLRRKVALGVSLAYWASPLDLIPDRIPLIGQVDDLVVIAAAVHRLLASVPSEVRREYWPGSEDALDLVEAAIAWLAEMVPLSRQAHGGG